MLSEKLTVTVTVTVEPEIRGIPSRSLIVTNIFLTVPTPFPHRYL